MKTSENHEIKPSLISAPSPKPRKYMYAKIMAYTVLSNDITFPVPGFKFPLCLIVFATLIQHFYMTKYRNGTSIWHFEQCYR